MGEVIILNNVTSLDIPADRVLDKAFEQMDLKQVVILGYDKDGEEYFASSIANGTEVLWLLERLKKKLLDIVDE